MYHIQTYFAKISTEDYLRDYVNIPEFLECCKECENYGGKWSCPPFDFDAEAYWKGYGTLSVTAVKIIFDETCINRPYTQAQRQEILETVLAKEKAVLSEALLAEEAAHPGSVSLSAGSCSLCGPGNCAKRSGMPCRQGEKMRYSIESLGGNVGLTLSKLLGIELQWMEEGRLPEYFVLAGGLLF